MENTTVIGYKVCTTYRQDEFVTYEGNVTMHEVKPCTKAEAYGRISKYLSRDPYADVPIVVGVTRLLSPMETAARELGSLLTSLCERHGLDLGLSSDQIEHQIAKELSELGATGVGLISAIKR